MEPWKHCELWILLICTILDCLLSEANFFWWTGNFIYLIFSTHKQFHLRGTISTPFVVYKKWALSMCLFVSAFPTQKARFEKSKYKKPVWLGIKRNFLEKIAFWVCEENAQCHKGAQRCILEKARAHWFISVGLTEQLPNYPSINFALFSSPSYSCSSVTDQHRSRKYQPNTNTAPPNYHRSTTTTHFNIW